MPIAHKAKASPGPLRQGDVLEGLELYIAAEEGPVLQDDTPFCVVLSRDCNALRAETVVVAAIRKYAPESFREILSGDMSLDEARRMMFAVRDGDATPDTCYLGPLLDGETRYAVSLDKIHTVDVPGGEARDEWIQLHRIFRLDPDFVRHLQVRLFSAVAKQGFDDFTWWPTQDLEMLVLVGENDVAALDKDRAEAQLRLKAAQQQSSKPKQIKGLENALQKVAARLETAQKLLADYKAELDKRKGDGVGPTE